MTEDFRRNVASGHVGEAAVTQFLMGRGWYVLPLYEAGTGLATRETGFGPRLFGPGGRRFIAPDLLVFRGDVMRWVEAKRKTRFAWYRKERCWTTGIDLSDFEDYLRIRRRFPFQLWLLFLHEFAEPGEDDRRGGCPPECPTGLFGDEIEALSMARSFRHGGMIYWPRSELRLIAPVERVTRMLGRMDAGREGAKWNVAANQ